MPPDIVEKLIRLDALVEAYTLQAVEFVTEQEISSDHAILLRYRNVSDLARYKPALLSMLGSVQIYTALIERTRLALARIDIEAHVVTMRPRLYNRWRASEGLPDTESIQNLWALLQLTRTSLSDSSGSVTACRF